MRSVPVANVIRDCSGGAAQGLLDEIALILNMSANSRREDLLAEAPTRHASEP